MDDPRNGYLYRHKKTGGLYEVCGADALLEATGESVVVYLAESDGQIWVRPLAEFMDGRFERFE